MEPEALWPIVQPRLRDYIGQTWNIQLVSELTGAIPETVGLWLVYSVIRDGSTKPSGVRLIVLWHLLHHLGMPSDELDELPPFNRYLGELVALKVVSIDEALKILNVKNVQTALQVLRGQQPLRPNWTVKQLREMYDVQLQAVITALPTLRNPKLPVLDETEVEVGAPNLTFDFASDPSVVLAALLRAALPYMVDMLDNGTPLQRSNFREQLVGQDEIFKLLNVFTRLQSERANANPSTRKRGRA